MNDTPTPKVDAHIPLVQAVFEAWNTGQQEAAVTQLREFVDQNSDQTWALAFLCWMFQQQGEPGFRQGLSFAKLANTRGLPWVARQFGINMLSNVHAWPDLLPDAMELVRTSGPYLPAFDPVGIAWNLLANAKFAEALQVMSLSPIGPFPVTEEEWAGLSSTARQQLKRITDFAQAAEGERAGVESKASAESAAIEKLRTELETKARSAEVLVDSVSAGTINSRFESDAESNKKESNKAFFWGLVVLGAAAVVTLVPLILHYLGYGPNYSPVQLLGAHASATIALAAVAGVLLARARHRDRARQRAADLSTAMGTIIVYSNQISDPAEKQAFMQTMGQLVLVAHLQADTGGKDDATVSLANLLAAVRTPTQ